MVDLKLVNKILFLNKHKQERLTLAISKLQAAKAQVIEQLKTNQQTIYDLQQQLITYKQRSYKEQFTNTSLVMLDVRKVSYAMEQQRLTIDEIHKQQEQLKQEQDELEQSIAAEQEQLKELFVKEAKFEYLVDLQVA